MDVVRDITTASCGIVPDQSGDKKGERVGGQRSFIQLVEERRTVARPKVKGMDLAWTYCNISWTHGWLHSVETSLSCSQRLRICRGNQWIASRRAALPKGTALGACSCPGARWHGERGKLNCASRRKGKGKETKSTLIGLAKMEAPLSSSIWLKLEYFSFQSTGERIFYLVIYSIFQ